MGIKKSVGAKPWIFPNPTLVVGTYGPDGKPNVMVCAWAGMCCSNPPSLSVSMRTTRRTMDGIRAHKAFTVSIPTEAMLTETDYAGIVSGHDADKFSVTKWTPVKADTVNAPYVGESPVVLECELANSVPIGEYTISIGLIKDVKIDVDVLEADGAAPDMGKFRPLVYDHAHRAYFSLGAFLAPAYTSGRQLLK